MGAVAFAATVVTPSAHAEHARCRGAQPLAIPHTADPAIALPVLQAGATDRIEIPFGDSWQAGADSVRLSAGGWEDKLKDSYGLVIDFGSGYLVSGPNRISSTEQGLDAGLVAVNPKQAELCFEVVPKELTGVKAGKYTGTINVMAGSDGRSLVTVPVTVTFRASRWLALGVALFGVLLGLAVKALSEAAAGQRENRTAGFGALKAYMSQLGYYVTVILGVVAGAFVFQRIYVNNGAWGASSSDFMKLFGLCFIAQLSSSEAVTVVRRAVANGPMTVPVPPAPGSV